MGAKLLHIFSTLIIANSVAVFAKDADPCEKTLGFEPSVNALTPNYLFLNAQWLSERTAGEVATKPFTDATARDYALGRKISMTHRDLKSFTSTFEPRGALAAGLPNDPAYMAILRRNYRGGEPAPAAERAKRKADLKEILAYEAGLWRHSKDIHETIGHDRFYAMLLNLYRERAERTIQFLIAEGVLIDITNNENLILSAQILPEGNHTFNRRAAQLFKDYDGLTLFYQASISRKGSFQGSTNEMDLSESEVLSLRMKSPTIGHELRHSKNKLDGHRNFGGAQAKKTEKLPGNPLAYESYQSFEEAETHSYTLRGTANDLLKRYQKGELEDIQFAEADFISLAFQSTIVSERNAIITKLLKEALDNGVQPQFEYTRPRLGGASLYEAKIPINYEGKTFHYFFVIYDSKLETPEQRLQYIRNKVGHMLKLNPNYQAQFNVTLQAAEKLLKTESLREKAALLEGIISITRPHFWEAGDFITVTEASLVERFNSVVSDRWARFTRLGL